MISFQVHARDPHSLARTGTVATPHGRFSTPAFMPVGTCGSIKGICPDQVEAVGTEILLGNTYHLHIRPGQDIVARMGGLHRFMGWSRPILTDSGGYQVFSLAKINKVTDDGVRFQSHVDGAYLHLDPETSIAIQNDLGADIIMAFDQCPPYPCERREVEKAVDRTLTWAARCKAAHRNDRQSLFGIVQGGVHDDLRASCAARLIEMDFEGYAVGGLSVGESHEQMAAALDALTPLLPAGRPRYLMGVGMVRDIVAAVRRGIDMFDCVLPTRNGRNAYAFTSAGPLRLRNEQYKTDPLPIEDGCDCYSCGNFSRAYLRHLFLAGEMLGPILTTIHNLRFFQRLMSRIRVLIQEGRLEQIDREFSADSSESEVLKTKD